MAQDSRLEALRKAMGITSPRSRWQDTAISELGPAPPPPPRAPRPVPTPTFGPVGSADDYTRQLGLGETDFTTSVEAQGPRTDTSMLRGLRKATGIEANPSYAAISELGAGDMSQIRGPRPSVPADPGWEQYAVSELGPASYPPPRNPANRLGRPMGSGITGEGRPVYDSVAEGQDAGNTPTPPPPPPMFRPAPSGPPPPFLAQSPMIVEGQQAPWLRQDINKGWMERGEGPGLGGDEWTQANQGPSESVRELSNFFRPTEELWQQAARTPQTVRRSGGRFAGDEYLQEDEAIEIPTMAPGAQQSAGRELYDRVGPDPFELYKANIPLQEQELANQGNLAQQEEVSRGNLGVARTKSEADANFFDRLTQLQSGGVDPSRISAGGRSVSFDTTEQRVPQALVGQLNAAKDRLEQARGGLIPSTGDEEAVFRQALGAVFAQDDSSPQLQELVIELASNPETANLPFSTLISEGLEFEGVPIDLSDPKTAADLNRLLNYARGALGGAQ